MSSWNPQKQLLHSKRFQSYSGIGLVNNPKDLGKHMQSWLNGQTAETTDLLFVQVTDSLAGYISPSAKGGLRRPTKRAPHPMLPPGPAPSSSSVPRSWWRWGEFSRNFENGSRPKRCQSFFLRWVSSVFLVLMGREAASSAASFV